MTSSPKNTPAKERRELRNYGILMAVVLGAIGGFLIMRGREPWPYFLAAAAAFGLLGLAVPLALRPLYKVWMKFAEALGWLKTRIILSIIFYLIFTPYGIMARLFGKDLLDTNWKRRAGTYWLPVKERVEDKKRYERMY